MEVDTLSKANFECKICESTFTSADELRQHLMAHIGIMTPDSGRSAKRRSSRHPSSKPADGGALLSEPNSPLAFFRCAVTGCLYTTDSPGNFSQHLGSHRNMDDPGCVYCGEAFGGTATLVQHMMTLHKHRVFQCGLCNYSAAQPLHVILHYRWYHEHSVPTVLTCRNVGLLTTPELMPRPREQADRAVLPYCCSVDGCSFKVIDPDVFKLHLTSVHSNLKQFICFVCNASVSSPKALLQHTLQHDLGAVMCGLCHHCELSLKAMLKHHCDYHPDGSLQIVFRKIPQATKFEQFITEFGQMSRYLPGFHKDGSHADTHLHASSCTPSTTRRWSLSPSDTYGKESQAGDSSPHHTCEAYPDVKAQIQQSSPYATPRDEHFHSAGKSNTPALYVVSPKDPQKRIPLTVFSLYYNIDVCVVVTDSERRLASAHLCNAAL